MTQINIQFTRFSAFYSPLIATIAGGFLKEQGLEPEHSVAPPGTSEAIAGTLQAIRTIHTAKTVRSTRITTLPRPPS